MKKKKILYFLNKFFTQKKIYSTQNVRKFGLGNSAEKFSKIISNKNFWKEDNQKYFNDII